MRNSHLELGLTNLEQASNLGMPFNGPEKYKTKRLVDDELGTTPPANFSYILFERVNPLENASRYYFLGWMPTFITLKGRGKNIRTQRPDPTPDYPPTL